MSNLLVVDVFESYYEGRKAPFPAESAEAAKIKHGERKPAAARGDRPEQEQPIPRAA